MQSLVALASVSSAQGPPKAADGGTLVQTAGGCALCSHRWMFAIHRGASVFVGFLVQRACQPLPAHMHYITACFISSDGISIAAVFRSNAGHRVWRLTCSLPVCICSALLSPANHSRSYNPSVLTPSSQLPSLFSLIATMVAKGAKKPAAKKPAAKKAAAPKAAVAKVRHTAER